MSDLDEIINELNGVTLDEKTLDASTCSDKIIPILEKIIACEPKPNIYDNLDLRQKLVQCLSIDNLETKTIVSKCIAEIARNEKQRMKFTNEEIIKPLLSNIKKCEDQLMELNIQTCRALGNICYSNDDARMIIKNIDGDAVLIDLLNYPYDSEKESMTTFIKVRCGLISNYLLGDDVSEKAVELKVIDKIEKILEMSIADVEKYEDLLLNTLPPLSILTEQISDLIFNKRLNQLLIKILEVCTNPDLAEICLVLLQYEAQNDDIKLQLAEEGLCEIIYKLLEKYKTFAKTNEARVLMKLACEIIVLILTGDKSMNYLYSTSLLKYMEDWLDSTDPDLLSTGVLAIGNFARTDSHCIHMVENNIMKKLLSILSNNNGVDHDMILQHALLSALRNLVIPKPNKAAVIEAGLVETILPMLEIHQPPVVFKLLGTLRMTVDGQEKIALELLANEKLISQLIHWSKSSDYAGVTGESFRLIAWLIKHAYQSHSSTPSDVTYLIKFIAIKDAVESMINMLQSTHLVMQNEALIALTIMSSVLYQKDTEVNKLDEIFIECNLGQKIVDLIQKSSDNMTKEIVENLQIFVKLLKLSKKLVEHLDAHNIDKLLESIPSLTEYCTL